MTPPSPPPSSPWDMRWGFGSLRKAWRPMRISRCCRSRAATRCRGTCWDGRCLPTGSSSISLESGAVRLLPSVASDQSVEHGTECVDLVGSDHPPRHVCRKRRLEIAIYSGPLSGGLDQNQTSGIERTRHECGNAVAGDIPTVRQNICMSHPPRGCQHYGMPLFQGSRDQTGILEENAPPDPLRQRIGILVHREQRHPVSGFLRHTDADLELSYSICERPTPWYDEQPLSPCRLANRGTDQVQRPRNCAESSTDLDDTDWFSRWCAHARACRRS